MTVFGEELGTTTQVGEMETVIEYVTNKNNFFVEFVEFLHEGQDRVGREGRGRGKWEGRRKKLTCCLACLPSVLYFPRKGFHTTC